MTKAKSSEDGEICAGGKPIDKSVLDRWRALSSEERADMVFLISQGFPPDQARALAMAGTGTTSRQGVPRKKSAVRKADYRQAFIEEAKAILPEAMHSQLHRRARARAGGVSSGQSRRAAKDPKASAMLKAHKLLKRLMGSLGKGPKAIDKAGPLISEILNNGAPGATPGIIGPQMSPKDRVDKMAGDMATQAMASVTAVCKTHAPPTLADHYIDQAYAGLTSNDDTESPAYDPKEVAPFLDAQRLLRGIDTERLGAPMSVQDARERASRNLARNMGHYDKTLGGDPAMAHVGGLDVDLGSGSAREAGYLGIDTYPYDHGTIIHDLGLGIPFPAGSCRTIRLVNSLDEMTDYADNPAPLLREIQRVLTVGGKLVYQGPQPLNIDTRLYPGLMVQDDVTTEADEAAGPAVAQMQIRRIPARLPIVYGADADWLSRIEERPGELEAALAEFGTQPTADVTMANLVHKKDDPDRLERLERVDVYQESNVLKADKYQQIVTGVVLSPDEVDSQGDIMSAEDIEKTAHQFLIDARVVGNEHTSPMAGAKVIESFIAPVDIAYAAGEYGPQTVKKGAWVLSVKVSDSDHWAEVLDGGFTGFSVGGYGKRDAA